MGERIQGLSIGLDLDTLALDRGLTGLKDKLKTVNSEMKANMSAFDRGDKSVGKYETRLQGLNNKLNLQKRITQEAKAEYEKMVREHGEGSKQAEKAAREYNNQAAALNNLERYVENATQELQELRREQEVSASGWTKLSESVEEAGSRLTKVGDTFKSVGKTMSVAITAPLAGMAFAANRSFYEVDEGLDNVIKATGATGDTLDSLKGSFKNVYGNFPVESASLGDTLGEVNTRFAFTDKKLEESTEAFLKFASITGVDAKTGVQLVARAMGDAGIEADDYAKVLDVVAASAQITGVSADKLLESITKYGAPMRALGFDMNESVALFASWEKAGVNAEIAMSGLKQSISRWGKEGKDPREEFKKTLAEIGKAPDIAAATALSIEAFGAKAGPDLADAIKGGRFEFEELLTSLEGSEGIVDSTFDSTQSGAQKFQVALQNLKLVGADLWELIETALAPVMEKLLGVLQKGVEWFKGLSDSTKVAGIAVAGIAAAIGPVLVVVGTLIGAIGNITSAFAPMFASIARAGGLFKWLRLGLAALTGPIGLTVAAVIGIGAAFVTAYKNSESFREFIGSIGNWFREAFSEVETFINGIKGLFKGDGQQGRDILASLGLSEGLISQLDAFAQNFSAFSGNFSESWRGITALFKGDGSEGRDILKNLGFTEGFTEKADGIAAKLSEFKRNISNAIEGIFALFRGDTAKAIDFLGAIGLSESVVTKISQIIEGIKTNVQAGFNAIAEFIGEIIGKVVSFVQTDGAQIMEAFKNIFNFIINTAKFLGTIVGGIFMGIFKTIEFLMPAILIIIQSVWNNIKGVITGALDIIMGAIKVFSGLFTGDFGKMWEGIKQMFFGAINFIWNFIQLSMFGKILTGAKAFFLAFRSGFSTMWNGVKAIFTSVINAIVNFVKGSWSKLQGLTTAYFNAMKSFYGTIWNAIKTIFTSVVKGIVNFVSSTWRTLSTTTSTIFNTIKSVLSNIWNSIKTTVSNLVTGIWTKIKTTWNTALTNTKSIFKGIYDAIKGQFDNIVKRAAELPKKIGDGIGNMAGKVKDGLKKVINAMAGLLGTGINGVIGGVNWVLGKVGITNTVPEWKVPKYAKGTDNHPGGPAVVGEKGREFAHVPGMGYTILGEKGSQLLNLPKGTSVLPNKQTESLLSGLFPAYASGIGWLDSAWGNTSKAAGQAWGATTKAAGQAWDATTYAAGKVKDGALDVWSYISDPKKLFKKALELFGVQTPQFPGMLKNIGVGGFNKVKGSMESFLTKQIENIGSFFEGSGKVSGNVKQWIMAAIAATGVPQSWAGPLSTIAMKESGGNPRAVNNWDINAKRGIPSKGLMQTIGPTFNAHKKSGMNDIFNPVHNAVAAIRYIKSRYGNVFNVPGIKSMAKGGAYKGYASGGLINSDGLYRLAEGGFPEWVIPTDPSRRTDAMKLLALAGRDIQGNKRPHQLPGAGRGNDNDSMLQALLEQNKLLLAILNKSNDVTVNPAAVNIDGYRVADLIFDYIDGKQKANLSGVMIQNGVKA
ncbi:phage tail tape measure protein [Metabacillus sp. 84]|uniref:phage tail tape measure protein n=1 Tax=Metabacillus sp. 84 TaxID=3404705 RepID=UPI003CF2F031